MRKNQNGIHDFFSGRNGMDNLSRFLLCIALILIIISGIFRLWILLAIGIGLIVYVLFRTFSRNVSRRYAENRAFTELITGTGHAWQRFRLRRKDRKTHLRCKCPNCYQKIRVPKGRGTIVIKCPNCRIEFKKNT